MTDTAPSILRVELTPDPDAPDGYTTRVGLHNPLAELDFIDYLAAGVRSTAQTVADNSNNVPLDVCTRFVLVYLLDACGYDTDLTPLNNNHTPQE